MKKLIKLSLFNVAPLMTIAFISSSQAANLVYGEAQYSVPVDSSLQYVADFAIPEVEYTTTERQIKVKYAVPPQLTGVDHQEVTMTGPNNGSDDFDLNGPQASGHCQTASSVLTCHVKMQNLQFNQDNLMDDLKFVSSSPSELNDRLTVAARFADGPIGIVTYQLK